MDEASANLKIPKKTVPVELNLSGQETCEVEFFLAEYHPCSWRHQNVLDLLEDGNAFLPAKVAHHDARLLFNKDTVVWVGIPLRADPALAEIEPEELFDIKHEIRLELTDGSKLDGQLLYAAPPDRSRIVDYMNAPGRFFRLWREDHVYLVNKAFLLRIFQLDPPAES
jgi:hypothetical protein